MLVGVGLVTGLVIRLVGGWEGGGATVSGAAGGRAWSGCGEVGVVKVHKQIVMVGVGCKVEQQEWREWGRVLSW